MKRWLIPVLGILVGASFTLILIAGFPRRLDIIADSAARADECVRIYAASPKANRSDPHLSGTLSAALGELCNSRRELIIASEDYARGECSLNHLRRCESDVREKLAALYQAAAAVPLPEMKMRHRVEYFNRGRDSRTNAHLTVPPLPK